MKQPIKDNKFKIGDTVVAKINDKVKLIIDDYKDRIYYCKNANKPDHKLLVYFEREIELSDTREFTLKKGKIIRLLGIIKCI